MLSLQTVIRSLPFLQKALATSKSQLLQIIHEVCKSIRHKHYSFSVSFRWSRTTVLRLSRTSSLIIWMTQSVPTRFGPREASLFADFVITRRVVLRPSMLEYMRWRHVFLYLGSTSPRCLYDRLTVTVSSTWREKPSRKTLATYTSWIPHYHRRTNYP